MLHALKKRESSYSFPLRSHIVVTYIVVSDTFIKWASLVKTQIPRSSSTSIHTVYSYCINGWRRLFVLNTDIVQHTLRITPITILIFIIKSKKIECELRNEMVNFVPIHERRRHSTLSQLMHTLQPTVCRLPSSIERSQK